MLAPAELARATWGADFKRLVRAFAAAVGLFDDQAIADAVGRSRNTVGGWWTGRRPEPETLHELARAIGVSPEEMYRYVYLGGDPPEIRWPTREQEQARREAQEWADSERRRPESPTDRRRG